MKIRIARYDKNKEPKAIVFEYEVSEDKTLLENLKEIKEKKDASLTFRCGCRSGVCGSCAIRVNEVERLACKTKLKENDLIQPLKNYEVIRDLVVNIDKNKQLLQNSNSFLEELSSQKVTKEDEKLIHRQSNCILCQSCYSSCPVLEVNKEFKGPFVLTRVLRYLDDKKEAQKSNKIALIQENGIWDCTLCGNCTMVCPEFIDSKSDILKLRMIATQAGYTDPNFQNFSMDFNSGFDPSGGFNPNGF